MSHVSTMSSRPGTLILPGLLVAALMGPARADVWMCEDASGVPTTSPRRIRGQRCELVVADEPAGSRMWLCMDRAGRVSVRTSASKPRGLQCGDYLGEPTSKPPGWTDGGAARGAGDWTPRPAGTPMLAREEPAEQREREALYLPWIAQAAEEYDLPAAFIRAVIRVESNFRARAESEKGAMGLMQLMPSVARELGVADPWEPRTNIRGGAMLLRRLADRFEGDIVKVLSAYHAGSGAVKAADGIPWEATEGYVRRVLDHYYGHVDGDGDGADRDAGDAGEPVPVPD